ncbi:MAG TPA: efflux RND transporter periplasmic adaptor subunit [Noviherbaspirillum sp.]|nr:efflux RND transporter periplasmic adaptor subunit [Noviherbaspirillum sp.]
MRKTILTGMLAVTTYASANALAQPLACLIEPDKVAEVGAPGIGIIEKVTVERGDTVKAGQVLAYLQADVERASVEVASARAQAEADLNAAIAAHELARSKVTRARDLVAVGFISKEAVDQAEAEARIAQNRVAQAQEAKRIAQHELNLSSSQLAQRSIRSPFSGIVVDRYRTEGERIEREPIVRVAKIDPLRVEVVLPLSQFGQVELGAQVGIKTDITGDKYMAAKVVLIDRVIDAASNTFRVRLALPNPNNRIPAGLRCIAEFGAMQPASLKDAAGSVRKHNEGGVIKTANDDRQPQDMTRQRRHH